ncbi:metastasis-associated protein MTA3-like [Saccoglossus kowalevskii]
MAANMYRVGDYVYFETSSSQPYLIRRIEELNKTPNGNVEAKVVCFYRRRDISSSLIQLADKHQRYFLLFSCLRPTTEDFAGR